jgi:DNA-binding CsgD family transcriptional regulator
MGRLKKGEVKKYKRPKNFDKLTKQERRVMLLTGRGYVSREVAKNMGIALATVDTYKERAIKKLHITRKTYPRYAFKLAAGLFED